MWEKLSPNYCNTVRLAESLDIGRGWFCTFKKITLSPVYSPELYTYHDHILNEINAVANTRHTMPPSSFFS
jgi:hypothetical protein